MAAPRQRSRQPKPLDAGPLAPRSARSGCTWPPRARPPRRCGPTPRRCTGSPPPTCSARPAGPAGSRSAATTCSSGWCSCWAGTAPRTPATSSGRCSSSSGGWPPRRSSPTRWPGCGRRTVPGKLVPVFTGEELSRLEQACAGRVVRRSAATPRSSRCSRRPGSALSELAGIRYDPGDPGRSDIDLWQREITVRGKGGKTRIVKISHEAARGLDRYLRARARHAAGLAAAAVARGRATGGR